MFFQIREDRYEPDVTRIVKIMPFPWATNNFAILNFRMFLFKDRLKKVVCFPQRWGQRGPSMSQSTMFCAANATQPTTADVAKCPK